MKVFIKKLAVPQGFRFLFGVPDFEIPERGFSFMIGFIDTPSFGEGNGKPYGYSVATTYEQAKRIKAVMLTRDACDLHREMRDYPSLYPEYVRFLDETAKNCK